MKLSEAKERLKSAGIGNHLGEARLLFAEFGGFDAVTLTLEDVDCDSPALLDAIERRCAREPLQYVLGYTYFYNEKYYVDPSVLVPRQDTEILVDYAVKNLPDGRAFLDLCTGSGCVGISVLANSAAGHGTLVDISADALSLAVRNAEENGVSSRADFICSDIFSISLPENSRYYAILSNPPYVSDVAYATLEPEIYKEPKIAFLGGNDGADFYRKIIPDFEGFLEDDGFFAFEIGYDQGEILKQLGEDFGYSVMIIKDFEDNDRVAVLRKAKK